MIDQNSQVYRHVQKSGLVPKFIILTKYLDKHIAAIKEGKYLKEYVVTGWTILNKYRTGGLGGSKVKWSKENCIIEAKKYKYKSEFKKNSPSAYQSARKNNWLNDCSIHMIELKKINNYWSKQLCMKEAIKYKTKNDWKIGSVSSYYASHKNNWFDELSNHML